MPCESKLTCKETVFPSRLEADIMNLQRFYKLSFNTASLSTPSRFLFSDL